MAAAGARAGETARTANGGRAAYAIKRLGPRPARRNLRLLAVAAAVVLLAAGGAALASLGQPGRPTGHASRAEPTGHASRAGPTGPSAIPARSGAAPAPSAPVRRPPAAPPATPHPAPPATPRPAPPAAPHPGPAVAPPETVPEVVGVGCPSDGDDTVTFENAPTGPGWMPAGGGWTGNGCDGSTLWTMDPDGKQSVPSTLTWTFSLSGASWCTLAVFVPSANAKGVSDYSVVVGPQAASRVVADVLVKQSAMAGQWLTLGSFPVSGPSLEITTAPEPGESGHGESEHGHHGAIAASAARAVCTA